MICPQCHSENREGAKFCNECGASLFSLVIPEVLGVDEVEKSDELACEEFELSSIDSDDSNDSIDEDDKDDVSSESESEEKKSESEEVDLEVPRIELDNDLLPFVPAHPAMSDPGRTADLSGIDECLVDSSYVPPQTSWRSGDTMSMPRVEGQTTPKQKEFRAPDPRKKKGGAGKRVAIGLALLLVVGALAAASTYYFELWGGKMVPDVVDMTQADAVYVLEGKGFSVRTMLVKSDDTEGVVLLMDPGAGTRQDEGAEVVIHVSEARAIPNVVGTQRDEAASTLSSDGFEKVEFVTQKSDDHEGMVLSISPEAGTKTKATTPVTVTVAVPFTVPDISGKTWDEAVALLEDAGYVAKGVYVYDENVSDGTLLGTDPAVGEKLASGSTVTINIAKSRGSELVAAATAYLKSAGSVSIGGTTYAIESVKGVSYQGSETTTFTIEGRAVTTLDGETVTGSLKEKSGTIVWDSANNIVSIS